MAYATAMPASNKGIVANAPQGRENLAMGLKQVGVIAVLALGYGVVFAHGIGWIGLAGCMALAAVFIALVRRRV